MEYQQILYEPKGRHVRITLNRPEALNAISPQLEMEMHQAFDQADRDPAIRAIILTGAGRAFSAGYDMAGSATGEDRLDPQGREIGDYIRSWWSNDMEGIQKLLKIWYLSKPVIAAVNGWAMGGGTWYALACDLTLASDQAVFGQPEVRHISNTTFLFAALAGWKNAHRYALTGDHIDAQEAYRIGLVNEVIPHDRLLEKAEALAERIALVPEPSVRLNKAITAFGMEAMGLRGAMLLNGALSALAHSSHDADRQLLYDAAEQTGQFKTFLSERDNPFRPEPFGPRSRT